MSLKTKAKALQKIFDDKNFIYGLMQNSDYIKYDLSDVFSYYLCTEDKNRNYSLGEIKNKLSDLKSDNKEIIDDRYYFQAYNGGSDESYKKFGLDDISALPQNVKESLALLESELGKTDKVLGGNDGQINKSFVTADPNMVLGYAMEYAPERLWAGPLCETGNYKRPLKTPIKIGETKPEYMMRIIENKISTLDIDDKKKESLLNAGKIVSNFYGSKRPRIAIIPEKEIQNMKASFGEDNPSSTLKELADYEQSNWKSCLMSGPNFSYEFGVIIFGKILPKQFKSISVPDMFELLQIKAIQRGAEIGDSIDPYSGKLVQKLVKLDLDVVRNKNIFSKLVDKLLKNPNKESKEYSDNGRIDLGGTGEMHLCTDKEKNEYLFKPAYQKGTKIYESYRADIQVIASKLQSKIAPTNAVECNYAEIDKQKGVIQPKIEIDEEKMKMLYDYYWNDGPLDEKIARQFMKEYVVDYCLCNYDAHYKNFIIDKSGNLRGIDKEQSLKYLISNKNGLVKNDDFMENNLNRVYGEEPTIYGKIFNDLKSGKLPSSIIDDFKTALKSLEKIPANEYLNMFNPYIQSLNLDSENQTKLYNEIIDRKQNLEKNILERLNNYGPSADDKRRKISELSNLLSRMKKMVNEKYNFKMNEKIQSNKEVLDNEK